MELRQSSRGAVPSTLARFAHCSALDNRQNRADGGAQLGESITQVTGAPTPKATVGGMISSLVQTASSRTGRLYRTLLG